METRNIDTINISSAPFPTTGFGYGLLYNQFVNHTLIPPTGWRVPTSSDYNILFNTTLASQSASYLKSTREQPDDCGWVTPGTDNYNFNWLPAGVKDQKTTGIFKDEGIASYLWCDTVFNGVYTKMIAIISQYVNYAFINSIYNYNITYGRYFGFSIRLIKESNTSWNYGDYISDVDGNQYYTVKIGSQIWTASNWKCPRYNNGTAILQSTDYSGWNTRCLAGTASYCSYDFTTIEEY